MMTPGLFLFIHLLKIPQQAIVTPVLTVLTMQEKATVSAALDKAKNRAAINFSLAERLNKLIGEEVDAALFAVMEYVP